jgi:SAM-dependent methyltransferase
MSAFSSSRWPSSTTRETHHFLELERFVNELPLVRAGILAFVQRSALEAPVGCRVLDAGAGDAPYRPLFAHCDYVTVDWPSSPHLGARAADISASLDALPIENSSFDLVLCTEVLEHVANPSAVLGELRRVLRPGGALRLTTPFVWPLHEEPFDYYRYTSHGLRHLAEQAGFVNSVVKPRNGYFTTLAQLVEAGEWVAEPGRRRRHARSRSRALARLRKAARDLTSLDHDSDGWTLPLGWTMEANAPG